MKQEKFYKLDWEKDFGIEKVEDSKCAYVNCIKGANVKKLYHKEYAFKCLDEDITNDEDVKQILEKIEKVSYLKEIEKINLGYDLFFNLDFEFNRCLRNFNFTQLNDNKDLERINFFMRDGLRFKEDKKVIMTRRVNWEKTTIEDWEIRRKVSSFYARWVFALVDKDVVILDAMKEWEKK